MSSTANDNLWYGMLETSKSRTIVIRDSEFPEGLNGRIYLYNADRDQVVEYVEKIVNPKLRELTADEKSALDKDINSKFKSTRKQFLTSINGLSNVLNLKTESEMPKQRNVEPPDPDEDETVDELVVDLDDDEIDDSWDEEDGEMSA